MYLDLYIILMQQRHLTDYGGHFEPCKLNEIRHDLHCDGGSDGSHYCLKINFWYNITDLKLKLTYILIMAQTVMNVTAHMLLVMTLIRQA